MKRLWIGGGVLAALLALSITAAVMMHRIHAPVADKLEQAASAWQQGDRQTAVLLYEKAERRWKIWRSFTAAFADHDPMDNIDELFARLPVYAQETDSDEFAAVCSALAALERIMAQSHLPWPENLLTCVPCAARLP